MESTEGDGAGTRTDAAGSDAAPGPQPAWLTVSAAALALGIKERAVRKRIAAGTLSGVRQGTRWLVQLPPTSPGTGAGTGSVPPIGTRHQHDALEDALRAAQRHGEELAGQLGYWQGRYQEAQATINLLTAAKTDPQSHERAQGGPQIPHAPAGGWRRWWWIGLYGKPD